MMAQTMRSSCSSQDIFRHARSQKTKTRQKQKTKQKSLSGTLSYEATYVLFENKGINLERERYWLQKPGIQQERREAVPRRC